MIKGNQGSDADFNAHSLKLAPKGWIAMQNKKSVDI